MLNDIPNNMRNVESAVFFKEQVENYFWANETSKTLLKHDLLEEQCDLKYAFCLD